MPAPEPLHPRLPWLIPAVVVALGSLVLSVIALINDPVLNRDGMLYVTVAREALEQGLPAAFERFDWPFLPLLLALGARISGLDPAAVASAYSILSVLLLSVLAVRIARRLTPDWSWLAVLFVLGAPVFNEYRADLLRGTGAWLFLLVALDQALLWVETPRRRYAAGFQASVAGAFLFRPEMAFLAGSVPLWLLLRRPGWTGLVQALRISGGLFAAGVLGGVLILSGALDWGGRLIKLLGMLDLSELLTGFEQRAGKMVGAVVSHHSSEEATQILFTGLLSVIFTKWLGLLGIFSVSLVYALVQRERFPHRGAFVGATAVYALVLVFFLTREFYLSSRYVVPLALFSLPWVCAGTRGLRERFPSPAWRNTALFLVLVSALSGVISTSPGKGYIRRAGEWIARQQALPEPVYYSDRQVAYFATGYYPDTERYPPPGEMLNSSADGGTWVWVTGDDVATARVQTWARNNGMQLLRRFTDGAGEQVRIYVPASRGAR